MSMRHLSVRLRFSLLTRQIKVYRRWPCSKSILTVIYKRWNKQLSWRKWNWHCKRPSRYWVSPGTYSRSQQRGCRTWSSAWSNSSWVRSFRLGIRAPRPLVVICTAHRSNKKHLKAPQKWLPPPITNTAASNKISSLPSSRQLSRWQAKSPNESSQEAGPPPTYRSPPKQVVSKSNLLLPNLRIKTWWSALAVFCRENQRCLFNNQPINFRRKILLITHSQSTTRQSLSLNNRPAPKNS